MVEVARYVHPVERQGHQVVVEGAGGEAAVEGRGHQVVGEGSVKIRGPQGGSRGRCRSRRKGEQEQNQ